MDFELALIHNINTPGEELAAILRCNSYLGIYGINLTEDDALMLSQRRLNALADSGRIEVGTGITDKLIKAFCASSYITPDSFADIIAELTEIFYYYKSDMLELADDDELIEYMHDAFENRSQGSLEYLAERELPKISENLRAGLPPLYEEPVELDEDEKENNIYD